MNVKGVFSHCSDEWSTPLDFFQELNDEFHFTLDPCSIDNNLGLENFFTKDTDGLNSSWGSGNIVFVNPPYSQISLWSKKCYEEFRNNNLIVLLIPARTDTKYFHDYILPYAHIRFIKGRLKFGGSKNSAPFPSILCIFRPVFFDIGIDFF